MTAAPVKLLILIQDERMPSSRVRVLDVLPELEARDIRCTVKVYPHRLSAKLRTLFSMPGYDAVLIQKKISSPLDAVLIRRFAKKMMYDFDDAVYLKHESAGVAPSKGREVKTRAIIRRADLVFAGNRLLQAYAAESNPRVEVVPSSVDLRGLPRKNDEIVNDPLIIGWVGGHINLSHLRLLEQPLKKLSETCDFCLHVVCDETVHMPGVKVKHIPWRLETQSLEIARFDIGIMPLPQSRHAEGKCGYKALQCMAAGVPVVVSDVGINREIVRDGVDGLVVKEVDGFESALKQLLRDPALRARMGCSGRKRVESAFAAEQIGERLAELIRDCVLSPE